MSNQTSDNNKRLAKNSLLLYVRMLLTMGISLYTSRVVLSTLGFSDYGIYNVVGGFVAMFSFVNGSMTAATQRFFTIELGKNGDIGTVFNTSRAIHGLLALVIFVLCESVGLWFFYNKMQIPPERMLAAFWTLQCSILATLVVIISVPYNAVIVAHEKMSAFAYISLLEVILKLLIVFLVSWQKYDYLIVYAILMLLVQIAIRLCYSVYCKRNFSETKLPFNVNKKLFYQMLHFAGWTMGGNLAMMTYTQGLNVLLNIFFGPVVNAARGIAVQVQNAIIAFCSNFMVAVKPQITKTFAQNDLDRMHNLIALSSKFSFYMILCVSMPLMLGVKYILNLWLGKVPAYTEIFLVIILCSSMIRSLAEPIITSIHATGNIKRFQLVEGCLLLCILPVSYCVLLLKYPPYSVFIVHLLFEIITQAARVFIVLPQIKMSIKTYLSRVVVPVVIVSFISPIIPICFKNQIVISTFHMFVMILIISMLSVLLSVYVWGINKRERKQLNTIIKNVLNKNKI